MLFDKITGHKKIIERLKYSVDSNMISHAQLFSGEKASGVLKIAIAYAQYVLCSESQDPVSCEHKIENLNHPDLHFVFPVNTTQDIKSKPISSDFNSQWTEFILDARVPTLQGWYEKIGIDKKLGRIGVDEASDMIRKMSLKSYEGGTKVVIIWMPELMNIPTANKLLKLIEEPVGKSLFLFVTEDENSIIDTIKSRTQIVYFNRLTDSEVKQFLIENHEIDESEAADIALRSNGKLSEAIKLVDVSAEETGFQELFVAWVRGAFKGDIKMLIEWTEVMAAKGKNSQIGFIKYAGRIFRQALLENYETKDLSFLKVESGGFKFENFIKFVHGQNIFDMMNELDKAIFHLERNGNAKLVLLDLSVKITRGLHTKYKA